MIEVMVALAVLTIALAAVIEGITSHVRNAAYLRDRTLAHWAVMNRISELQITGAWPSAGTTTGTTPLAGRDWFWTMIVYETDDADVRRADIEVRDKEGGAVLGKAITYLGQPL